MSESRLLSLAEGLKLLAKYSGPFDLCAENDVIYAGHDAYEKMSPEERATLRSLGWTHSMEPEEGEEEPEDDGTGWHFYP